MSIMGVTLGYTLMHIVSVVVGSVDPKAWMTFFVYLQREAVPIIEERTLGLSTAFGKGPKLSFEFGRKRAFCYD